MLQVMAEKGLVRRDEAARAHVYRARESRRVVLRRIAKDLLARAFDGSMQQLVVHALDPARTTQAELAEIRELLDDLERRGRDE
jgi:predicted transcriptional regulator